MYDNINKKHGLGRVTNPTNAPIPETPQGGGRKNTINRLNPSLANNVDYKYLTKDTFPVRPLNWNTRFYDYSNAIAPLGNATAEDCANYCVTLFSDLTRMVTMQNLFHDGGFSNTGVTSQVIEKFGE